MAKVALTARMVERIEVPATGRVDYFDQDRGAPAGFGLRVSSSGTKAWFYVYRRGGALKRWTIGRYPILSLADAREKARKAKADGGDPARTKAEEKRAETFHQLAEQFLEAEGGKLKEKTLVEWKRIVDSELIPYFGEMKPHEITRGDIRAFLEGKAKSAPYMANRILEVIRRIFTWGLDVEKIQTSPVVGLKKPGVEKSRERVLSHEEIRKIYEALKPERPLSAAFFEISFLSAARRGEVLAAKWKDLDLDEKLWTIPDTKGGRSHTLPLTDEAVKVFRMLQPLSGNSEFVFLGPNGRAVQSPQKAVARLRKRTGLEFRVHDIRRSVATGIARLGVQRETISSILNHVSGGPAATRVYVRDSHLPQMRQALTRWALELERIRSGKAAGAEVVPFRGA